MFFWKAIIYLYLLACKYLSTNAAFSKISPIKDFVDVVEGSRSRNPFSSQCKLVPHTSYTTTIEYPDINPTASNNERNFKDEIQNGEGRSMQLHDRLNEPNLSIPFLSDWGDDLMFFATEWDVYPAYSMESYLAGIQYDLAAALESTVHNYHDHYIQNNVLWENNHSLLQQDETLGARSRIGSTSSGVAESQPSEHQSFGLSSLFRKKSSQSSNLKVSANKTSMARKKIKKGQLKVEGKKIMKTTGKRKSLKDTIGEYKLKVDVLSNSSPYKTPFSLFLEIMDNHADNESSRHDPEKDFLLNPENLERSSRNSFIKSFLGDSEFPICQPLFDKLNESYKERNRGEDMEGIYSHRLFFKSIHDQVVKNCDKKFYIRDNQLQFFFNLINYNYKFESEHLKKISKKRNYCAEKLANYLGGATTLIPWSSISTFNNRVDIFEKREYYQKKRRIAKFGVNYGTIMSQRFDLRKLFLVYSTLINKVLCNGEIDTIEIFCDRQKDAMNMFDETMKHLEIDFVEKDTYFIKDENIPLKEEVRNKFLRNSLLRFPKNEFQIKIIDRNRGKITTLWKLLALWLAKDKYIYFRQIYLPENRILQGFKKFFNSLFFYILGS
ncbi:hypothetical protein PPACK8108_LOCUS25309 [Phakopsora pachyrhizi]|uniref:Uncharacterized protein n=1 Tax=Phakopsora pachyrhizi TaxID=170000 RepID=A0AAV0BTF8_PHAPC|nr:hypothetical protein PPACK8108_LOCUS25309 [Phakopsora pachyrhizi]